MDHAKGNITSRPAVGPEQALETASGSQLEPAEEATTRVRWACRNCNGQWNGGPLLVCDECATRSR